MSELKPCPACHKSDCIPIRHIRDMVQNYCGYCGFSSRPACTQEMSNVYWNTRAGDESITPEVLKECGFIEGKTHRNQTYFMNDAVNIAYWPISSHGHWGIRSSVLSEGPTTVAELRALLKMLGIGKGEK